MQRNLKHFTISSMFTAEEIRINLRAYANPEKANILQRFFKTKKGEYGEGDIFLGVMVPYIRKVAKKYKEAELQVVKELLYSKIHEERLCALLILVEKFAQKRSGVPLERLGTPLSGKGAPELFAKNKKQVFDFYLKNMKQANNWDLVDLSAPKIAGEYLLDKPKDILYKLAISKNIWARRVAIISTFSFIKNGKFTDTIKISEILLQDKHDLIQKAVGWMLREVGKRSLKDEEIFLKKYYKTMPRTTLRYAIEKFPEGKRLWYLRG